MIRVLVIDDSQTVVARVKEALARDGVQVSWLEHFLDLGPVLRAEPPDLILLDLNMPALSGASMGRFIRKYQRQHIPIVLYSGTPTEEMAETAASLGASGFVSKDAPVDALRETVRRVLDEHRGPAAGEGKAL